MKKVLLLSLLLNFETVFEAEAKTGEISLENIELFTNMWVIDQSKLLKLHLKELMPANKAKMAESLLKHFFSTETNKVEQPKENEKYKILLTKSVGFLVQLLESQGMGSDYYRFQLNLILKYLDHLTLNHLRELFDPFVIFYKQYSAKKKNRVELQAFIEELNPQERRELFKALIMLSK